MYKVMNEQQCSKQNHQTGGLTRGHIQQEYDSVNYSLTQQAAGVFTLLYNTAELLLSFGQ